MTSAKLTVRPLTSTRQTAAEMARLAVQYRADLGEKASWPLPRFFNFVRKLPYRADPTNNEWVSRPGLSMAADWPHRDCDDKAILMGAWCASNKIPFQFVASSKRPDKALHHVFTVARFPSGRVCLDATYPHHRLGQWPVNPTKVEILTGEIMTTLSTLEGEELGFSLTKAVKSVGRVVKKTASAPLRPSTYKKALRPSTYVKAARSGGHLVMEAKRGAERLIASAMPDALERMVKRAVRSAVGNRTITPGLKAIIIPPATAAALAVPGAQAFAPAIPVIVNSVLDELIKEAKQKLSPSSKPAPSAAAKNAAKEKAMASARDRAAKLKSRITAMKSKAAASAPAATTEETAEEAAPSKMKTVYMVGGGAVVLGLMVWAFKGKKG